MEYLETIKLKDGRECILRNCMPNDAADVLDVFNRTHAETDFMMTYCDEIAFTVEQEKDYLAARASAPDEIEIGAFLDGKLTGTAGIEKIGSKYKVRLRAEFGIGILKEYWGLGIGHALTAACIECAQKAGYAQLELNVVRDNSAAISLYRKFGFVEFGCNPKGFRSRYTGWQELVLMRREI